MTTGSNDSSSTPTSLGFNTDKIASQYEKKINESIFQKTLNSATTGNPVTLTKEEALYLKKKQSETEELKIVTPTPTFILKKGATEIPIPRAAELVQKMDELYPTSGDKKPLGDGFDATCIGYEKKSGMTEYEKKCSPPEGFDTSSKSTSLNDEIRQKTEQLQQAIQQNNPHNNVNKNAYEIRLEILKEAAQFSSWSYQADVQRFETMGVDYPKTPTTDDIIALAAKFYKFVENKNQR